MPSLRRRPGVERATQTARSQLQKFRRSSALAVAITALILIGWGAPAAEDSGEIAETPPAAEIPDAAVSLEEATGTMRDLSLAFFALIPKLIICLGLLLLAWVLSRVTTGVLRRLLGRWERTEAVIALSRIGIYIVAIAAGVSILAGNIGALLGSVGLIGLALSWALQTPIESFTGWLLNSFKGYYRVGDRIEVGDVFGDVYRIDVLTTTVWEAGGPGKPVAAAQTTGALITFPNWEVLRNNIINYSREFPYVWDEVTVSVTNESDIEYTLAVLQKVAERTVGSLMQDPIRSYRSMLEEAKLLLDVDETPRVFLSQAESWTNCTIRYLAPVRTRRRWSSALILAAAQELKRPEHRGKIMSAYPRTEVRLRDQWEPSP